MITGMLVFGLAFGQYRDIPEASLLGERQMRFLDNWASDWSGPSYMKVVLSQTNFASVHTIP